MGNEIVGRVDGKPVGVLGGKEWTGCEDMGVIPFTPQRLMEVFNEYAVGEWPLKKCCEFAGVDYSLVNRIRARFPEVNELCEIARMSQAEKDIDEAEQIIKDEPLMVVMNGEDKDNKEGLKKAYERASHRRWKAERLLSAYKPKHQTESKVMTLTATIPMEELMNGDVSTIMNALRNARSGNG